MSSVLITFFFSFQIQSVGGIREVSDLPEARKTSPREAHSRCREAGVRLRARKRLLLAKLLISR